MEKRSPCAQSKRQDSTTMPPSAWPWPLRNLVVEWQTMSAPQAKGFAEIGGRQGVVDNQRDARLVGDRRHALEIDDDPAGIGEVLEKDRLGARGQRLAEIFRIGRVDKMALPAELFERQPELGQRAAVEGCARR